MNFIHYNNNNNNNGISVESTVWLFSPLFPGRIGIWKCWFLQREENWSTRRKTLGAGTRTNNKLNPHMTPSPGIEPGPHWWEACVGGECSTTVPSLLPIHSLDLFLKLANCLIHYFLNYILPFLLQIKECLFTFLNAYIVR